jgi:hypothetical protein
MSLNWNIGSINDYKVTCFDRLPREGNEDRLNEGGFMGPFWYESKDDPTMLERLSVTTHTLIFATLSVDMGSITEKNADEFFRRLSEVEREGAYRKSAFGDVPFTLEEVKAHIGLTTNVATMTKRQWAAKQKRVAAQRERERAWVAAREANV